MQYLDAVSKMTEWSVCVSKANHSVSQYSKSVHQPLMPKKLKLNGSEDLQDLLELTPKKRCPLCHRGLECKSRKSGDTWSNRQVWPWSTKWSRAKANRVLSRECIGHSKHPFPTTQEKTTHGHYQMVNTKIRLIIFFAAKMKRLYTVTKNKTESWLWLRSWTLDCKNSDFNWRK